MSYVDDEIQNAYKFAIDMVDETMKFKDSIIKKYSEQVDILTDRNLDLAEQVDYWTNLYRELKNAEGETK